MGFIGAYKSDGGDTWREMVAGNDWRTKLRGKRWLEKFGGRAEGGKINAWTEVRGKRWREENWRESRRRGKIAGTGLPGKQKWREKKPCSSPHRHGLIGFGEVDCMHMHAEAPVDRGPGPPRPPIGFADADKPISASPTPTSSYRLRRN